jgi:hypothetical protein
MKAKRRAPKRSPKKSNQPTDFPPPAPTGQVLFQLRDVCRRYGVTRFGLRKWILLGRFPKGVPVTVLGHPRWHLDDLQKWEQEMRAPRAA